MPYLRSDELGTHITRLSLKRVFVKPHDFQIFGEVPHPELQYTVHCPRDPTNVRSVDPPITVDARTLSAIQLDAWGNEGGRWLGRVRRADGRVSFIDQNDIDPAPDRATVSRPTTRTTATDAGPMRESVVTLVGGPWDRMVYYASDWEDARRAESDGITLSIQCAVVRRGVARSLAVDL